MMEFIDLKRQYSQIRQSVNSRIQTVLDNTDFINGSAVNELEAELAKYVGVKQCIATSSGTDALLLSLMLLDLKLGDEVITTPFTFISTVEMICLLGATPVLVDIDPKTCNINVKSIEDAISINTKAILPVSLYGQPADFDSINSLAQKYNLLVIEDGAQSFGATYKGRRSCALSDIGCTSFFPSKPLGCYGDGGAIFTNSDEYAARLREFRNHGQSERYVHSSIGLCARLDTIQAAVLLSKLSIFDDELKHRERVANEYLRILQGKVQVAEVLEHVSSPYGQFTVMVKKRDKIREHLQAAGIPTSVHYPIPIHKQLAYKERVVYRQPLIHAEIAASLVLSLPFHPYMNQDEIGHVCSKLIEAIHIHA